MRYAIVCCVGGHWTRVCTTPSLKHALCEASAWLGAGYEVDVRRRARR